MSSFCTAKATHIFFSKKFQHICVSLNVNFNESLTNDIVSFEQLGPSLQLSFLCVFFESKDNLVDFYCNSLDIASVQCHLLGLYDFEILKGCETESSMYFDSF